MALSAEDREAIRETMARYCWHVDRAEWESWLGLFTPDGSWGAEGARPFEGGDALRKLAAGLAKKRQTSPAGRHYVTNHWIEEADGEARLRCYALVAIPGAGTIRTAGEFEVVLVKFAGDWRIRSLRFHPVAAASTPPTEATTVGG